MFPVKQTKETISTFPVLDIVSDLHIDGEEKSAKTLLEEISLLPLEIEEGKKEEEVVIITGTVKAGDTLYKSLIREGITKVEILDLQEKIKSVVDLEYIPAGSKYSLKYNPEGIIEEFTYEPTPFDIFHISLPLPNSDLKVVKEEIPKEIVKIEGTIKNSLYDSMVEYADSAQIAVQMAEIFAWEIDFLNDCQQGDTFKIIIEKQSKGDFYRWGNILAAEYAGALLSRHNAILFEDPSGNKEYYNKEGKSLQKAFLKAPLNYEYISSYFTKSRLHPITRTWQPHLAIDYAAPKGTPVLAIGSGTVVYKGWSGGYGNYIKISHPNNYETGYGHLSGFVKGLKNGQKIEQGDIIGYVGATGLATGAHLDFSISEKGVKVDFLKVKLPAATSIDSKYITQFNEVRDKLISALENKEELDLNLEFKDLYSNVDGE